jgi:hypothetical protein
VKRVIKSLPVKLTRDETEDRSRTVARLSGEIADAERKIEAEKERAKARVKEAEAIAEGLSAQQRALSRVVLEGQENRDVSCTVKTDRRERVEVITRDDTGEHVETRPLSDTEVRAGATWQKNLARGVAELKHPEDPDLVLDVRDLTDEERQVDLPVETKKSKRRAPVDDGDEAPI